MRSPVDTWYGGCPPLWTRLAELPFAAVTALRRGAYRTGMCRSGRLRVPVVVVGNLSVGGTGKTPLVQTLVRGLAVAGRRPGIVSRGYGGARQGVSEVTPESDPARSGDEPLLLARSTGFPVFVGKDRLAAGQALLARHPECDLVVSDDGLQHYRLARDVEIVVVDASRGFGNGHLLPAGPLREPISRLRSVAAIVVNGDGAPPELARWAPDVPVVHMRMAVTGVRAMRGALDAVPLASLAGRTVHAVAGIGNPARYFDQLRAAGLTVREHAFPDHHAYRPADFAFRDGAPILMTEKDAVKCERFEIDDAWVAVASATLDANLPGLILARLERRDAA
jgi:tetraacyldisaccharide 4'-kinase